MSMIWDRLSIQCRDGIFDIDGIALLLEVMKIPNGFVFGGAHDFRCFLRCVKSQFSIGSVISFLIRDYEPHFISGMLFLTDSDHADLLIIDSTPDSTPNLIKWEILIRPLFTSYRIFMNTDRLQYDDYSCKLFSLNVIRRLNKRDPREIQKYLVENGVSSPLGGGTQSSSLFLLPENKLLSFLMKDVQSLTRLARYLEHQPNDGLNSYISRHSEFVPDLNKKQNYSICHHLARYRCMLETLVANTDYNGIKEILTRRLGLQLIPIPHIPQTDKTWGQLSSADLETIVIPMITPFPGSEEIPWSEDHTTPLFLKRPEKYPECVIDWLPYRVYLRRTHCIEDTWIDLARYKLTYNVDMILRQVVLSGSRENLDYFLKDSLQEIRENPISMIERGCSQLLATHHLLTQISLVKRELSNISD